MFFYGEPIKVIDDNLDLIELENLRLEIDRLFSDKWKHRSLNLMTESLVLKAITPFNIDRQELEDETTLRNLLLPLVEKYVGEDETIVYLDVSSLPPGAKSLVHFDYMWMHMATRRIRIPLSTNPQSLFVLKSGHQAYSGVKNYNLKVGKVYETNNQCLHYAHNRGNTQRWHIAMDVMDKDLFKFIQKKNLMTAVAVDPVVTASLDPLVISELTRMMDEPPENV